MAEVVLKNVCKFFGDVQACRDISMTCNDGEFLSILGPSGCGKSTTMRMIAGLETISSGEIYVGGRLVNDLSPKQRNIAMVFENYALYPHMTVFENIAFPLSMSKMKHSQIREKVNQAISMLRLQEVANSYPATISDGQKQRVGIGRAIVREPDLFLFDEPISHLDIMLRQDMRREIVRLQRELDTTMIYVTHDQLEALTMGDRIAVMNDSYLQQLGTRKEILENPSNTFVAGFVGEPPINLISAELAEEGGSKVLRFDQLSFTLPIEENRSKDAFVRSTSKEVTIGIRPQYTEVYQEAVDNSFAAAVHFVEFLDEFNVLSVVFGDTKLMLETDKSFSTEAGENIWIKFPESKMLFFNRENGTNILKSA